MVLHVARPAFGVCDERVGGSLALELAQDRRVRAPYGVREDVQAAAVCDPDDDLGKQFIDSFWFFEGQYRPFTFTNAERGGKVAPIQRIERFLVQAVKPYTPAPAAIERTAGSLSGSARR